VNNRGLFVPEPVARAGFDYVLIAFAIGIIGSAILWYIARRRQMERGTQWPVLRVSLVLMIGLPLFVYLLTGRPLDFAVPQLRGFNFIGGIRLSPELVALLLSLILYTASFIAEIVRAGIQSVPRGQTEAALALGLRAGPLRRLVIMPEAMRVIIPPLTNQYLNLTKNSSLAVFIGYPDLVQIFAGTVLNQTGAAVQVIFITMAVYLAISLTTSAVMNLYARRTAIRER
jgi:general L-amino acid transport system permease protein